MNCLALAIRTVPDVEGGRRLYGLQGVDDDDVVTAMSTQRYQQTDGRSDRLPHHLQRIAAIAVVERSQDDLGCRVLEAAESDEAALIQALFACIEQHHVPLVSWGGRAFALPVLSYRALLHGLGVAGALDQGDDERGSTPGWNPLQSRHLDLQAALAVGNPVAEAPMDQLAGLLGLPVGGGLDDVTLWRQFRTGELALMHGDCLTEVLDVYLIYLRYQYLQGRLDAATVDQEYTRLRDWLAQSGGAHAREFLSHWR